ncbi:MAG: choice-of-anchor M domain-containing protein [Actinomycetota bacterium]
MTGAPPFHLAPGGPPGRTIVRKTKVTSRRFPLKVRALLTATVAIAATLTAGQAAAGADDQLVLDSGHVDAIHLVVEDDRLEMLLREDVTGQDVVHDPQDVVLHVSDAARFDVPDNPDFAFLGEPGASTWLIPEVQDPNVVWAGWSTEEIPLGALRGDTVSLILSQVEGPGSVHIFNNGPVGEPVMVFDSRSGQVEIDVPTGPGNHAHANWAFSEPGQYRLTFTASGDLANGSPVRASASYTIIVGPLDGLNPSPTDPSPTDPSPTDPSPTDPSPTDPSPTDPSPTDPSPTDPSPTDPSPTDPSPTDPSPTDPSPTDPSPTDPSPTDPSPTDPSPNPGGGSVEKQITASIPNGGNGLVLSVDPGEGAVVLPEAELAPSGDRWQAGGALDPVRVTDTRRGSPGWNVTGRLGNFDGDVGSLPSSSLGWTPAVAEQPASSGVVAGAPVPPGSGDGLGESATLASAPAGSGSGTSVLGAQLRLSVPADTVPGRYTATLVLTVI